MHLKRILKLPLLGVYLFRESPESLGVCPACRVHVWGFKA